MSDPTPDQQPGAPSSETQNPQAAEHMIPKSRFDEVNEKLRKLEADAAKRTAEQQRAADAEKAKRGEFETLANDRAAALAKIEAEKASADEQLSGYRAVIESQVKARIKALPEAARAKLPDTDPLSQMAWLDAVEAAVQAAAPTQPMAPRGTPSGGRGGTMAPGNTAADLIARKRQSGDYSL